MRESCLFICVLCVQEQDLYGLNLLCFDPKDMKISGEAGMWAE